LIILIIFPKEYKLSSFIKPMSWNLFPLCMSHLNFIWNILKIKSF
jgi:hypothetical protein